MLEMNRDNNTNRPERILESFISLYSYFSKALKKCDLTMNEFLMLSYIHHFGRPYSNNGKVIMRSELGDALGFITSEGGVSNVIKRLNEKGLIKRAVLTTDQKKHLYDEEGGSSAAVVISKKGLKKIDELKDMLLEDSTDLWPFNKESLNFISDKELKH